MWNVELNGRDCNIGGSTEKKISSGGVEDQAGPDLCKGQYFVSCGVGGIVGNASGDWGGELYNELHLNLGVVRFE